MYIVEAAKFKRDQYKHVFEKKGRLAVKVHERGSDENTKYYVYEKTAKQDANIIIAYLKVLVGSTKNIKYHVHASPSCREFCAVGRSESTKTNKLGDSLGTFRWTCEVIKLLKTEFKNKMTWSIEDAKEVAGPKKRKKFDFPALRALLPDNTFSIWDFTLWGVPQDRKRFIALDKSLNIDNLPKPLNTENIDDEYLSKLVKQLDLDETKNDGRKYSRTEMEGRIGMDKAFELAEQMGPEGVTHMMGQNTFGQVPNLIRVYNKKRKAVQKELKAMEKTIKEGGTTVTKRELFQKKDKYAQIYCDLTTLAYQDLVKFIQSCTEQKILNFYKDEEIKAYVRKSRVWLDNVKVEEVKDYCEAMFYALEGVRPYAFATKRNKQAHSQIPLTNVLKYLCKDSSLYPKIKKVNEDIENAKILIYGIILVFVLHACTARHSWRRSEY